MKESLLKSLWKRSAGSSPGPIQLNLEPSRAAAAQPRSLNPIVKQRELVPGNFFFFEMFLQVPIRGTVHIGSPKVAIRDITTGKVRWGSKPQHSYPQADSVQIPWIDNPESGMRARPIARPEDMLGAEGILGEYRFRFERILDLGKNVVVYALLDVDRQIRMAYGFNRDAVDSGYISPAEIEMRRAMAATAKQQETNPEPETAAGE